MRVLLTGATGVIGAATIPVLVGHGHEVRAAVRRNDVRTRLAALGADAVCVDLFDAAALMHAAEDVDAIVHMATAIPPPEAMTRRAAWAMNDRLRREVTATLVDAAIAHGIERVVQQSVTYVYADGGERWIDESSATGPVWSVVDSALDAEAQVRRFTDHGGTGVVLRLSGLYGPGRVSAQHLAAVAARKIPIVGGGRNFVSRLHIDDAATAINAALAAPSGTFNVSDDRPRRARDELLMLADLRQARRPRSLPRWFARAVAGPASRLLTVSHRISAHRFRDATGWAPRVRAADEPTAWTGASAGPSVRQLSR